MTTSLRFRVLFVAAAGAVGAVARRATAWKIAN
jgi:hypothetical protein